MLVGGLRIAPLKSGGKKENGREAWRQWNLELGIRPPASPSCKLYPPGRSLRPLRDGVEPEAGL